MSRYRRAVVVASAILVSLAGFVLTVYLLRGCSRPGGLLRDDFTTAVWREYSNYRQGDCIADNPRWKMADDLMENHLRRGMTRAETRDLLGSPDNTSGKSWDYCLGMWSGFQIDYDFLTVTFDNRGRLVEWGIWQD